MASVRQLLIQCSLYLALIELIFSTALVASTFGTSLPADCPDKCGNISIPYPFGTNPGCYRDGFGLTCNDSTTPPKVFLGSEPASNIELLGINITFGEARVYKYIGYRCYNNYNQVDYKHDSYISLSDNPYHFSNKRNKFTVIGCYTLAYIVGEGNIDSYQSGCLSFCSNSTSSSADDGTCNGLGCCQTSIPEGLFYYGEEWGLNGNLKWQFNPCNYAVLVEEDWYKFEHKDLSGYNFLNRTDQRRVPIILDWAIRRNGTCLDGIEKSTNPACLSNNSGCYNTSNGEGYLCKCLEGYEGNPYLPAGCIDIDECNRTDNYPCSTGAYCTNTEGGHICSCPKGTKGNPYVNDGICIKDPEKFPYPARVAISSILGIVILLGLCFLVATYQQQKRYLREKEQYQRYYEMMDNHLRVFSKKQIETATDNYNETHVLGRGGQGNVYKGLLDNNQVVAIKKAKEIEETQKGEFVNEIILLSQINHKNIVRMLGCCLEVKIPMLVYEFVPNGSLFDLLHRTSKTRPISLGTRLKIALESAVALDHLHSAICRSIIHGDVKSANILLDANYTAKVSDFGASSVVPVNEIVELVHFSYGYLDPECLCTQTITKNSDVYSFGVVILELVTRMEAIYIDEKGEKQPLATCFLSKAKKSEHREMLDVEIVADDENVMEVLEEICEIAVQCLSPKGEDRPTMRQVAEELQKLMRLHNSSVNWQVDQEELESSSISDASAVNTTQYSAVLEINTGAPR